ncbi:IS200/IS605 family transposase [Senegalia sp. (in: firmicutes)]|uniref:IS200/IS605 family transposase n=1 Tax=Senegalia sp. (in: firmicutes) TaxID=1924098 RepID=UPI003F994E8A
MELQSNNHSVFNINFHLILVTKYRRKVINDEISNRLKEIFENISPRYNIELNEWNHDKDHVHILYSSHPNTHASKFINAYKSAASRLIKKEFPEIKEKLWEDSFWSKSFCLISTGGVSINVIKEYIESQWEK